jgi:hypothetical protein
MALELLSADEGVEQVAADEHGHDEAEKIRATHVPDERGEWGDDAGAHIFSIARIIPKSTANIRMPSTTETMSMDSILDPGPWRGHAEMAFSHKETVKIVLNSALPYPT